MTGEPDPPTYLGASDRLLRLQDLTLNIGMLGNSFFKRVNDEPIFIYIGRDQHQYLGRSDMQISIFKAGEEVKVGQEFTEVNK